MFPDSVPSRRGLLLPLHRSFLVSIVVIHLQCITSSESSLSEMLQVDESRVLLPSTATSSSTSPTPLVVAPKRAVLVCKTTRWEYEKSKMMSGLFFPLRFLFCLLVGDDWIERRLTEKGVDGRSIRAKHWAQKEAENRIVEQLKHLLPPFLTPSCRLRHRRWRGWNFPRRRFPRQRRHSRRRHQHRHPRIRGSSVRGREESSRRPRLPPHVPRHKLGTEDSNRWIEGAKDGTTPILALNDVFIGEKDSAKVSYYDISVDGSTPQRQKSSGIVVSTGTGSTAWYTSITRIHTSMAKDMLRAQSAMGISLPSSPSLAEAVAEKANEEIFRPIDSQGSHPPLLSSPSPVELYFAVREPIFNQTFLPSPARGSATRISLTSRCSEGVMTVDGSRKFPFAIGTTLHIEISPIHSLRTLL